MCEAIVEGCLKEGIVEPEKMYVFDTYKPRLEYLKKTFGVNASSSASAICKNTDLIIVAVKPQNLSPKFWGQLRENLNPNSVLLSIVVCVYVCVCVFVCVCMFVCVCVYRLSSSC